MPVTLRHGLVGLTLAALPAGLWFLGTRFGGEGAVWDIGAILTSGALFLCFAFVVYDSRRVTARKVLALGYVVVACAVWFVACSCPASAVTHVENGTPDTLAVELDGRPWLTVPPGGSVPATLSLGTYRVTVAAEGGPPRDDRLVTVGNDRVYVLNLLGARTYHRGVAEYRTVSGVGLPFGTTDVRDVWFAANVDFLFADPPPSLTVNRHQSWTTRTFLKRGPGPETDFLPANAIWGGPGVPLPPTPEPDAAPDAQAKWPAEP